MATSALRTTRVLAAEGALRSEHATRTCRVQIVQQKQEQRRQQQHNGSTSSPRRRLHSTAHKDVAIPIATPTSTTPILPPTSNSRPASTAAPSLSCLSLDQVLRTYLITAISSQPTLMNASTNTLRMMLESKNPLFNLSNPLMRGILWETFYKQFCAGENRTQIKKTCEQLRAQGYAGVILEMGREVLKDADSDELKDVFEWRKALLETVAMANEGDFVALKWSGLGVAALRRMAKEQPPSKEMDEAMHAVCQAAAAKNISLLPSAEETWNLNGYHDWTLNLQRAYNVHGKAVMYNTYQCYLKQAPETLARHLQIAKDDGFTAGVKLVRGAYLASEKRDLIWPTIEGTHHSYDTATSALIHRQYNDLVKPAGLAGAFPDVNAVIASHNAATVEKAQNSRQAQFTRGEEITPLVFAQLQGMADEVSCSLLARAKESSGLQEKVFKATTWGTMHEALNYLLRRAAENKDAASRTADTRNAMKEELGRRFKSVFGMA